MFTQKISKFVKRIVLAAVVVGAAGPAIAAVQVDMALVAKKQETILAPQQKGPGCWTDEGYGRISSCDAG